MHCGLQVAVDLCTAVKQRRAQAIDVLSISLSGSSTAHTRACKDALGAELSVMQLQGDCDRWDMPLHQGFDSPSGHYRDRGLA